LIKGNGNELNLLDGVGSNEIRNNASNAMNTNQNTAGNTNKYDSMTQYSNENSNSNNKNQTSINQFSKNQVKTTTNPNNYLELKEKTIETEKKLMAISF